MKRDCRSRAARLWGVVYVRRDVVGRKLDVLGLFRARDEPCKSALQGVKVRRLPTPMAKNRLF